MGADVGSGCGIRAFREADCLGEVYELLLARTAKLLESSLGLGLCGSCIPSSGCLPIGSLRHSPSSGGIQGRGFRREKIRAKIRATAFRARFDRVFGIRANGSVRHRILCIGVVKIRDEEAELFFKEPVMPERFASLSPV